MRAADDLPAEIERVEQQLAYLQGLRARAEAEAYAAKSLADRIDNALRESDARLSAGSLEREAWDSLPCAQRRMMLESVLRRNAAVSADPSVYEAYVRTTLRVLLKAVADRLNTKTDG